MNIRLTIPTTWNDLSSRQVENICHALHCNKISTNNQVNNNALEINTITHFIISKELLRGNRFFKVRVALKQLRVKAYAEFSKFIYTNNALHRFPEYVKINGKRYYGPAFRIKNVTIGEFSFVDALYYKWSTTNEVIYLDVLCSALYRRKAKRQNPTDIREPFNKMLAETNTELFQKLSLKKKLAIAYAFEGSRNYLVNMHPNIFPKRKTNPEAKTTKPPKYVPFGKLISAKIQYDPSKIEAVENILAYKFFSIYENELIHIKTIEKQNR